MCFPVNATFETEPSLYQRSCLPLPIHTSVNAVNAAQAGGRVDLDGYNTQWVIQTENYSIGELVIKYYFYYFLGVLWDWVHLVRRPLIGLLYQLRMIDDDDCGAVGGMRIGRGNRSTRRKSAPAPPCPPQIPHDLTWAQTRAATMGSPRLTTWAMVRPKLQSKSVNCEDKWLIRLVSQ
jgi:hypothetical protein